MFNFAELHNKAMKAKSFVASDVLQLKDTYYIVCAPTEKKKLEIKDVRNNKVIFLYTNMGKVTINVDTKEARELVAEALQFVNT